MGYPFGYSFIPFGYPFIPFRHPFPSPFIPIFPFPQGGIPSPNPNPNPLVVLTLFIHPFDPFIHPPQLQLLLLFIQSPPSSLPNTEIFNFCLSQTHNCVKLDSNQLSADVPLWFLLSPGGNSGFSGSGLGFWPWLSLPGVRAGNSRPGLVFPAVIRNLPVQMLLEGAQMLEFCGFVSPNQPSLISKPIIIWELVSSSISVPSSGVAKSLSWVETLFLFFILL